MQSKNIIRIAIVVGLILLVPLTLQLTIGTGVDGQGFNWKIGDFIFAGALLFVTGLGIDTATRKITLPAHRIMAIGAIVLIFLAVWVHLAVGIVDSWPFAGS